jgi:hypothetical protein
MIFVFLKPPSLYIEVRAPTKKDAKTMRPDNSGWKPLNFRFENINKPVTRRKRTKPWLLTVVVFLESSLGR